MSHCDRILNALRDGRWHTSMALYIEVGHCVLHSRISDLRHKGHIVEGRHVPGKTGAEGYEYRLASSVTFVEVAKVRRQENQLPLAPAAEQLTVWDTV